MHGVDTKAKSNVAPAKLQKLAFKWKDVKGEAQEIVKGEKFRPKALDKSVGELLIRFLSERLSTKFCLITARRAIPFLDRAVSFMTKRVLRSMRRK